MQIEPALIAAVASFFGAWIAARLAFARFSREKIWERKTAAYTAIFEALHYIGRWYDKHYDAALIQKDMDEAKKDQLKAEANKAEDELERRLASETWLIPAPCRSRLEKMSVDLKNSAYKHTMWCKRTASRASAGSDATSAVVGVEALSTGSQKSAKSANGRSTGRYAVSISASRAEPQCCRSSAKVGNGRPIFRGRFGRVPKRRPPPLDESRRSSALAGGDNAAAAGDAPHLA